MLVIVDNHDSFSYNLLQAFGELGQTVKVIRANSDLLITLKNLQIDRIVISSGPQPKTYDGVCEQVIKTYCGKVPILGVGVGHLYIAKYFDAKIVMSAERNFGKKLYVSHDGQGVFQGLSPDQLDVACYHSSVVSPLDFPSCLQVSAVAERNGEIMAIRHRTARIEGVQFHPESYMTPQGMNVLKNFLTL